MRRRPRAGAREPREAPEQPEQETAAVEPARPVPPPLAPPVVPRASPEVPGPALVLPVGADAADTLRLLEERVAGCRACRLAEKRSRTVFGSGSATARLMFVGEGPGAEEDRQGLPFVGPAGELLTRMITAMGFDRAGEAYIANVVKCRPPGNRDPQADEAAACRGFLDAQIDAVRPAVLVALGRIAAQALLGTDAPLGRLRGRWHEVRGIPLRVTYHPSAVLRSPEEYRRPTWEDLQIVRDRLRGTT